MTYSYTDRLPVPYFPICNTDNVIRYPRLSAANEEKITIGLFLAALNVQAYALYGTGSIVLPVWPDTTRLLGKICGATYLKEKAFGFFLESPSSIYLVFRGTQNADDLFSDLSSAVLTNFDYVPNSGKVGSGFDRLYSSMRNSIIAKLRRLDGSKTLYITGHSMGGALTTLCALDVAVNTQFTQPYCVSFASPLVGNAQFVSRFDTTIETGRSIRVQNTTDLVPMVPPTDFGFKHVKGGVYITVQTGSSVGNHGISSAYFPGLAELCPTCAKEVCGNNPEGFCPAPY